MIKRGFLLFPTFFYSTRNQFSSSLASFNTALLLSVFLALSTPTSASKDLGEVNRYEKTVDLLGSVYLVSEGELLVCGKAGILGVLTPGQENASNIRLIDTGIKEDFLALSVVTQDEVLIGSSQGNIYRYKHKEGTVKHVASVSEYVEPVLAIDFDGSNTWVVGGRGLLVTSPDKGESWLPISLNYVKSPPLYLPSKEPEDWYLGASNIDPDSVKFDAHVNGRPVIEGTDYEIDVDEGRLFVKSPLDAESPASIEFEFKPGPPYRGGDVAWSVVIANKDEVTIAGEFGLILKSFDGGKQWVRLNGKITSEEPAQLYWLSGAQRNESVVLGGAAGKVISSSDGGRTWEDLNLDSKEGVFDVEFISNHMVMISGAVGLLGVYREGSWQMADRTALELRSWLKNITDIEKGKWMILGGRSSAIVYSDDGWKRNQLVELKGERDK